MNDMNNIQQPDPFYNAELEQQLLGAVLVNNETFNKLGSTRIEHFFDPVHQDIWRSISARIAASHLASPVTLKVDFENHEGLSELGGPAYLARLAGASISAFAAPDYAAELAELHNRREMHTMLLTQVAALKQGGRADDARSAVEVGLQGLEDVSGTPRASTFLKATIQAIEHIDKAYQTGNAGIPTGIADLDKLIGGLVAENFIIIAGDTSMGKSAAGLAIAYNVAKSGYGVGFASLEMSDAELAMRINSIESKTAYQRMRNGQINEGEFKNLIQTAKSQEALPIHIYNSQVRTVGAIMSEAKRSIAMMKPNGDFKGFGVLIVDYIQLIRGKGQGRYEIVTEISQQLKAMAKVLGVPVIGIAQLSRGFKQRDDMRPHLSDLKDSSQLEQDADAVIFCYRDHYYLERQEPPKDIGELADWEAAKAASENVMELIVAKQRMGPVGKVRVGCDIKTNRFWDLDHQDKMQFE